MVGAGEESPGVKPTQPTAAQGCSELPHDAELESFFWLLQDDNRYMKFR